MELCCRWPLSSQCPPHRADDVGSFTSILSVLEVASRTFRQRPQISRLALQRSPCVICLISATVNNFKVLLMRSCHVIQFQLGTRNLRGWNSRSWTATTEVHVAVFRWLCKKFREALVSFVMSVRPSISSHAAIWFPLGEFPFRLEHSGVLLKHWSRKFNFG